MTVQHEEALRILIEGFRNKEINESEISDYLLDKTRFGLNGFVRVANRSLLRNEPVTETFRLEGWDFFKDFANMLGLVYSNFCSKYEDEQNWVNRKSMYRILNISERTFDRFQKQVELVMDFHVQMKGAGVKLYHKRNMSELFISYQG